MSDNINFDKHVLNPYPTGSQSYTAWEAGFLTGRESKNKILLHFINEFFIKTDGGNFPDKALDFMINKKHELLKPHHP